VLDQPSKPAGAKRAFEAFEKIVAELITITTTSFGAISDEPDRHPMKPEAWHMHMDAMMSFLMYDIFI